MVREVNQLSALCLASHSQAQSTNGTSNSTILSLFISPAADIAFALNVPSDSTTDLYFSIIIPTGISWGAIGLGSTKMAGSLILMAYSSASGENVTLSPRLAYGHSEPVYTPDILIEALSGTGFINETKYVFNGRCSNCRLWNGGELDVASRSQGFLYATGPDGNTNSDAFNAPLKMHYNYGNFRLDMIHATGPGAVPVIPTHNETLAVATTQGLSVLGKQDIAAMLHAIIMVFCFVGLFPFGILILRLGSWVRWHAVNQGLALIGVIVGVGLGIHISFFYNRSKNFSNPHQIIGILLFIFVICQFILGFMHHRIFKKTENPTKLAPVHVWLGRVVIVLGVVNAFLGFPFALSPTRNWILAGLVIFIFPILGVILLSKNLIKKRWNRSKEAAGEQGGYDMEPWRQVEGQPGYEHRTTVTAGTNEPASPTSTQQDMRSYANYHSSSDRRADLGTRHAAHECV
ncbi:integral membrane protein [Xylariales sp. AK1849]|nr:integral membrane protein [Xylariales sp. AK1849]